MKIAWTGLVAVAVSACASKTKLEDPVPFPANPCATADAAYLFHYEPRYGSSCGPLSDDLLEVGLDHEVYGWSTECADRIDEACTRKRIECATHYRGRPCWSTSQITYADDGSSVSGVLENDCLQDGAWCHAVYDVSATRL